MKRFLFTILFIVAIPAAAFAAERFPALVSVEFSPTGSPQSVILNELSKAQRSVEVAAYGISSPQIVKELVELKKSGVDVAVYCDRNARKWSKWQIRKLRRARIFVRIKKSKLLMHNKYMIIDGSEVITGSYNFSKAAATEDNNIVVIRDSPEIVAKFEADFQRMLRESGR